MILRLRRVLDGWNVVSEFLTRLSSQIESHESFEMDDVASEFESRVCNICGKLGEFK